jgi:hypothetical protein
MYATCLRLGRGDIRAGFDSINHLPYQSARKEVTHPVSCVDCHDAQIMQLRVTHPAFMEGIRLATARQEVADLQVNRDASRQEMRTHVCGQRHVEYYVRGPQKSLTYPWAKGLTAESILAYYDSAGPAMDARFTPELASDRSATLLWHRLTPATTPCPGRRGSRLGSRPGGAMSRLALRALAIGLAVCGGDAAAQAGSSARSRPSIAVASFHANGVASPAEAERMTGATARVLAADSTVQWIAMDPAQRPRDRATGMVDGARFIVAGELVRMRETGGALLRVTLIDVQAAGRIVHAQSFSLPPEFSPDSVARIVATRATAAVHAHVP